MKKILVVVSGIVISLGILYVSGPKATFEEVNPDIPTLSISLDSLDSFLAQKESLYPNIKPENESRIHWFDSIRQTEYAMVYLHGFSAGVMESDPVHFQLAKKYGCNLYLPRLAGHGLDDRESFKDLTPYELVESAKEGIAIGQLIGKKVILLSCSTGGTLSIYLTANNPELIHAQILYSPNLRLYDPLGSIVTQPWGQLILKSKIGEYKLGNPEFFGTKNETYWTLDYRYEGILAVQALLDQTMNESVFSKIQSPYFLGYYYKNEEDSDHIVSIEAMQEFDRSTSTPTKQKVNVPFPNVGDHVIASGLRSKDIESVMKETSSFIENILGIEAQALDHVLID